jgi:hypothetical protein
MNASVSLTVVLAEFTRHEEEFGTLSGTIILADSTSVAETTGEERQKS